VYRYKTQVKDFYFCIDATDSGQVATNILSNVEFYFKVNYSQDQVDKCESLGDSRRKILPALPFFPVCPPFMPFLFSLFRLSGVKWWMRYIVRTRVRELRQRLFALNIDDFIRYRMKPKVHDVFFVMSFYSEEHHWYMNEFRYEIMRSIQETPQCSAVVGFVSRQAMPSKFEKLRIRRFNYKEYVEQFAKSKIGIYVRGSHHCISAKFGHLLSMGKPIAGQTLGSNQEVLYANPYFDEQFAHNDPEQISSNALQLLREPDKMKKLSESNSNVFDQIFSPKAVAADLLLKINRSHFKS
jgi:hypothetical protein